MKKLSSRAIFALILAIFLAVGTVAFCVSYVLHAQEWVTFSGSPHVYTGANLDVGAVTDRSGTVLLTGGDQRAYASDAATRTATLHLLGDRYGYIYAPLLGHFADKMLGYDLVNGLYTLEEGDSAAELTISAQVQKTALAALGPYRGTIGVYNYKTGEILCAATSPSYDPDNVPDIENDESGTYKGVYVNRFFDAAYTPGSIFKIVTTAAALETQEDALIRSYLCEGKSIIGSQNVICEGVHNTLGLKDGLAVSCNCVFGQLSVDLGAKTLTKYAENLGLVERLECDGNKSAAGTFDLRRAGDGDVAWAGIGQHTDQVTAYAFLRLMGVIGGGGEAAEPHLMAAVTANGKGTYRAEPVSTGRLLKEETARTLTELMRYNVEAVYGQWQFGDLPVCAKSGTAEVEGQASNAMFAGFVADEDLPLAFVVFVEEGGHGSAVAAPMAAQVLQVCRQVLAAEN